MTEGFYYGNQTLIKTCAINDFLDKDETEGPDENLSKYQYILSEFEKDSIIYIGENEDEEIQMVAEELNKLKNEFRARSPEKIEDDSLKNLQNEEYDGMPLE